MIHIFHGDDQKASRTAYNDFIDSYTKSETLRLDSKDTTLEAVNNFLNGQSLFTTSKLLCISNFYSLPKTSQDKITSLINQAKDVDIALWQDKKLTVAQTSVFPGAKIQVFAASSLIFACSNAIKPRNLQQFISLYHQTLQKEPFDFLFYIIKGSLRRQLSTYSKFPENLLKNTYLQLIELDYQNKSGQLTTDREIALERIVSNLINHS